MFSWLQFIADDRRFRVGLSLIPLLIVLGQAVSHADSPTARYFDELRRRRLFRLAESACLRQLSRERVSPEQRGRLTLELSRTYAEHAKFSTGAAQTDLWDRARRIITERIKRDTDLPVRHARRLRLQFAIVNVLESEFLMWQTRLFPHDGTLAKLTESKLSAAVAHLQGLQRDFDKAYRRSRSGRRRASAEDVAATELRALLRHLDYQLAIALINQAESLPKTSRERRTAVATVETMLRKLTGGQSADAIAWNSRVLLIAAARLADRRELVSDRLKALERTKPPISVIDRTTAERVKVFSEIDQYFRADEALKTYHRVRGGLPGELSFLRVKTDLKLWTRARDAKKEAAAAMFLKQAAANAAEVEKTLGGYWGYRCRVLLANSRDQQNFGSQLATAIRKARSFHRHRKLPEAAAAFASAIAIAQKTDRRDVAVDLRFTLGSILLESKKYATAAAAFRENAVKNPSHPRAADAHLMWAYCLGRGYDADRTKTRRLAYTEALDEHRGKFAGATTAAEATWMLAMLQEHRLQLTVALKLYLEIPADHARGKSAQVAAARCLEGILVRLRELKRSEDRKAWEDYAVKQLSTMTRGFPTAPKRLDLSQAEVAMRLARIQLNRAQPDYPKADALLQRVFDSAMSAEKTPIKTKGAKRELEHSKAWTALIQIARQLRIVSLAGRGQIDQAREALKQLSNAGAKEVLAILDGLMQLAPATDANTRRELGLLQLHAAVELDRKRKSLSASEQAWLDRCLAQAYASSGQIRRAIEYYEKLLASSPRNRSIRKTTAELLLQSSDRAHLAKAKTYWRRLEGTEEKGSRAWLTSRYKTALSLYRLREFVECRKLLKVTKLLYPQLGGAELKRKYDELTAKLSQ